MEYAVLASTYEEARKQKFTPAGKVESRQAFQQLRQQVDDLLKGRRPFHWPLEFPEVFAIGLEEERGFSAIVSNPPFQGSKMIIGAHSTDYREYMVKYLAGDKRGSADLCAYFFLRASQLVRQGGQCGLLATNTIAQGDTREVGLEQIVASGWTIIRAISSRKWPGTANLEVAHVWMRRGSWLGSCLLDEKTTETITSLLTIQSTTKGDPYHLLANKGKAFRGHNVYGMGFVLEPEEALSLLEKDIHNRDVLFPFLNGEDLNSQPAQLPGRWVINFRDWSLVHAEAYPECIRIVREKVKPERDLNNRPIRREQWWRYGDYAKGLELASNGMKRVLAIPFTSKYMICAWVSTGTTYSNALSIIVSEADGDYTILQSTFHAEWAHLYGSTLETRMRYTASDCFETFPFPTNMQELNDIGKRYNQHRQSITLSRQEGLTKTYNRFHDPQEMGQDIVQLRVLHKEMDEAVARVYGWDDLDLGHGFHETKQGLRFTISEEARREVLGRLLKLNHERYSEEVAMGLHEKGTKGKSKKSGGKRNGKGRAAKDVLGEQGELVFE